MAKNKQSNFIARVKMLNSCVINKFTKNLRLMGEEGYSVI